MPYKPPKPRTDWHPSNRRKGYVILRLLMASKPLGFEELLKQCEGYLSRSTLQKALKELIQVGAVTSKRISHKHVEIEANPKHLAVRKMQTQVQHALDFENSRLKGIEKVVHDVSRDLKKAQRLGAVQRKEVVTAIMKATVGAFAQAICFELFIDAMVNARSQTEWPSVSESTFNDHVKKIATVGRDTLTEICETDFKTAHTAFIEWESNNVRIVLDHIATVEKAVP